MKKVFLIAVLGTFVSSFAFATQSICLVNPFKVKKSGRHKGIGETEFNYPNLTLDECIASARGQIIESKADGVTVYYDDNSEFGEEGLPADKGKLTLYKR